MSKALVIKNADFSTNKVTTITFNDVACTGVSFDSSAVTVEGLGTATIGYTLTPSNTTDTVTITSSDTTVISVSGTTLTANGIGTSTLTLTCGGYSATCTVTVDIYEDPTFVAAGPFIETSETTGEETDGIRISSASMTRAFAVGSLDDGFFTNALAYTDAVYEPTEVTAIKIPDNTAKIHIEAQKVYGDNEFVYFVDVDTSFTYSNHTYSGLLSSVALSSTNVSGTRYIDQDVEVPEGATGYIIMLRPTSSSEINGFSSEDELATYVTETMGLSIHYLAE